MNKIEALKKLGTKTLVITKGKGTPKEKKQRTDVLLRPIYRRDGSIVWVSVPS